MTVRRIVEEMAAKRYCPKCGEEMKRAGGMTIWDCFDCGASYIERMEEIE